MAVDSRLKGAEAAGRTKWSGWVLMAGLLGWMMVGGSVASGANAGYVSIPFSYESSDGKTRDRMLYAWYPSMDPARSHGSKLTRGVFASRGRMLPGRHPMVLFSHGFRSTGLQEVYLMEALARSGYIVLATNHADS